MASHGAVTASGAEWKCFYADAGAWPEGAVISVNGAVEPGWTWAT
ncbi:hypothetical protein [Polaromonas sp.]